jgi:hypothetical protein
LDCPKSVAPADTVTLLTTSGALPVLVTVMLCEPLDVPTVWPVKVKPLADKDAMPCVPVPDKVLV